MLGRILIAAAAVALASAQDAPAPQPAAKTETEQIKDFLTNTALALRDGPAASFTALFDPKIQGLAQISKDVARTQAVAMIDSRIAVASDEGSDTARNLQLDWTLRLQAHDLSAGLTTRTARVTAKVEKRGDKWLFTSFAPADFFRPGPDAKAWDMISAASSAMRNGSAEGFLADFDRKAPEYENLAAAAGALVQIGQGVESSLELTSNEGTDTERTLVIDWTLTISQGAFGGNLKSEANLIEQRHETVHVKAALQGKKWRLVSIEPLAFFEPKPIAR